MPPSAQPAPVPGLHGGLVPAMRGLVQQGPGMPFEQVTVEPGGTTTVVSRGGGESSWKLRHPPRLSGSRATSSNLRM